MTLSVSLTWKYARRSEHIYHSIVCIGALVAHWETDHWAVDAVGAPHVGERTEKELITAFCNKIAELSPRLVTFNGHSFDLPVLRYRAMVLGVSAPGLSGRPYFHRYSEDAIDLCDVFSSFSPQGKASFHEISREQEISRASVCALPKNRSLRRKMATWRNHSSVRTREYLTTAEIERLMAAARKSSRYGHRDATMILIGYRHGLRVSELCDLQWSQVELATGRLHVRRAKNGSPSVHPMQGDEIRALRRLQREQGRSSHVFMTERDGPMTPKAFHALFGRIGAHAKMAFPIHPHMLRHGCGYALANAGHDTRALQAWLGHKNIQHTVRYTELSPHRFKDFWR